MANDAEYKKKVPWEELLDYWGLGEERILREIDEGLGATVDRYYQDILLGTYADGYRRQRCLELLADLHGKRKTQIDHDVTHHGQIILMPGRMDKKEWQERARQERLKDEKLPGNPSQSSD